MCGGYLPHYLRVEVSQNAKQTSIFSKDCHTLLYIVYIVVQSSYLYISILIPQVIIVKTTCN